MFREKHNGNTGIPQTSEQSAASDQFPLNLIRTYSQIFAPRDISSYYHLAMLSETPPSPALRSETENRKNQCPSAVERISPMSVIKTTDPDIQNWAKHVPVYSSLALNPNVRSPMSREFITAHSGLLRRHRGEKKAIPEEQKDGKYFERRKRNNEAAKRSRDARKLREDRIALRATILEQENAILRSQNFTLRDEITTLRQMIFPRSQPGSN